MRLVLPALLSWWRSGSTFAMATVVGTWDSAPQPPGAVMLVGADHTVVGSVSGGCVESDVFAVATEVIGHGRPTLQRYGVTDSDAAAVGLPCGGTLEVFIEPVSRQGYPELEAVAEDVAAGRPVAVATVVQHREDAVVGRRLVLRADEVTGTLGSESLDATVTADLAALLATGTSRPLSYGPAGEPRGQHLQVFAACFSPPPRMLVFGATDFAAALARMGAFLGYAVTVCDARPVFATADRFPAAEVVLDWPHRYLAGESAAGRVDDQTVLCVLTHDAKFDLPLLELALRLPAFGYLGALGSRRTVEQRGAALRAAGVTEDQLSRLASPMGLDLGARSAEETAVSIAAEIVRLREGATGQRLADLVGPIHATRDH